MKLRAKDQLHVSSVQADSLRPGKEFEVSSAAGKELLKAHPNALEEVSNDEPEAEKAEAKPQNKAEDAPANKAVTRKGDDAPTTKGLIK
jgi:hypothetical protein